MSIWLPPIPRRELKKWAREELLAVVDEYIETCAAEADDLRELRAQCDRIAKLFGRDKTRANSATG